MCEREPPCVERLSGKVDACVDLAIHGIVENRIAKRHHVHPNLMRATRFENEHALRSIAETLAHLVMRDGGFPIRSNRVFETIVRVSAEGAIDRAFGMRRDALHEAEIRATDLAAHHRFPERRERSFGLRDHEQSRRIAIETMYESRAQGIAREILCVREERVDERPVARSVRGMRDHARGLIDHE